MSRSEYKKKLRNTAFSVEQLDDRMLLASTVAALPAVTQTLPAPTSLVSVIVPQFELGLERLHRIVTGNLLRASGREPATAPYLRP
jgi:hypothetical protein